MSFFIESQSNKDLRHYKSLLKSVGSLSGLFSDSDSPYINYRVSENLFCKSFNANNLSRSDVSADASKDKLGIGIKTFLEKKGQTWQKVAEFNKEKKSYHGLSPLETIIQVSRLRNKRIDTTKKIHNLENIIYHCVTRNKGVIRIYEENMDLVQEDLIKNVNSQRNIINYTDGLNEYKFNLSKSTLYKKFISSSNPLEIKVDILEDPFEIIERMYENSHEFKSSELIESVVLPLYSDRDNNVPSKSGLNQWNAGGRKRDYDEIYIPIPSWIHREFPSFFPPRDESFDLVLPNGNIMSAKLCQSGSKALMSNPNKSLGKWLLRDVLSLKKGELLTMNKLEEIGLDSVQVDKKSDGKFYINFKKLNTYTHFKEDNN